MLSALLTCAFGTGDAQLFQNEFGPLFRASEEGRPLYRRALTSPRVIRKLRESGMAIQTPDEAFLSLIEEGIEALTVNTLLLADGAEYRKILAACDKYRPHFKQLTVIPPLLSRDVSGTAAVLSRLYPHEPGREIVLLGHGSLQGENSGYTELQNTLLQIGRPDMRICLTETGEEPDFTPLRGKRVLFAPLMLCAGHHIAELYEKLPDICHSLQINDTYIRRGLGACESVLPLFKPNI